MATAAKKKPPSLALLMADEPEEGESPEASEDEDDLDPAFVDAAEKAFPDLAGDTERLTALRDAMRLCGEY